jgi:GNAT superfamily N-acetyltransferase
MKLHEFSRDEFETAEAFSAGLAPAMEAGTLTRHRAEGHVCAVADDGRVLARCSWWAKEAPSREGERPGVAGHFAAAGDGEEAALAVLDAACRRLREAGCSEVFGPMDGNTWRRYRWVTDRGDGTPFLMEPWNPPEWPAWWERAGFSAWEYYQSARVDDLGRRDPRFARVEKRLRGEGVVLRPLEPENWERDLRAIYDLSVESFARNVLYAPLPVEDFLGQYAAYREKVRPEFVLLAMHEGRCAGFAFCIPDHAQALRGEKMDTLLVKTVAVRAGRACAGLGGLLAELAQTRAREAGFAKAIHALALESNPVTNITARCATAIRRYALYRCGLANDGAAGRGGAK